MCWPSRLPTLHCGNVKGVCTGIVGKQLCSSTLAVAAAVVRESGCHTSRSGLGVQYIGKLVDGAMVANNPTLAGLSFMVEKQKV